MAPVRPVLGAAVPVTDPLAFRDCLAAWRAPALLAASRPASAWTCITAVVAAAWTTRRRGGGREAERVSAASATPAGIAPVVEVPVPVSTPTVAVLSHDPVMLALVVPTPPVPQASDRDTEVGARTTTAPAIPGFGRPLPGIPAGPRSQAPVSTPAPAPLPILQQADIQPGPHRRPGPRPQPLARNQPLDHPLNQPLTLSRPPTPNQPQPPMPAVAAGPGFGRPASGLPVVVAGAPTAMTGERPPRGLPLVDRPAAPRTPPNSSHGAPAPSRGDIPSAPSSPSTAFARSASASTSTPRPPDAAAVASELARHHGNELARALAPVVERWVRPAPERPWSRPAARLNLPR
ncbi:MAG: hypothetical protein HOV87_01615 [Catenulispora sp.]|nr:hypothetical protein [Catenulispora sp.]